VVRGDRKARGEARRRPAAATGSAKSVRIRSGSRLISDGPFAETKEVIAGYDVIECETEAQAIEIAGLHPVATFGSVEVRPFWDWAAS